jgi:hypothetical protein
MKTMMLATAAVVALGVGSAFAGEGGPSDNSPFTRNAAVAQAAAPSAVAANQQAARAMTFVTGHSGTISLFSPDDNGGANS